MSMLKDIQKTLKTHHLVLAVGVLVIIYFIAKYSNRKGLLLDGMSSSGVKAAVEGPDASDTSPWEAARDSSVAQPAVASGVNEQYASVNGGGDPNNVRRSADVPDPSELLPKDQNSEWARLNPAAGGDLSQVNLLKAGHHMGVNTVGSSLRNANLQLRSEPPNPKNSVSPWNNSTIEPDLMRVPLELGSN